MPCRSSQQPFSRNLLVPSLSSYSCSGVKQQPVSSIVGRQTSKGVLLKISQAVRVRVGRKWIPGKVHQVCQQPHSYFVRTLDGREFRRTRRAINVERAPPSPKSSNSIVAVHQGRDHQAQQPLMQAAPPTRGSSVEKSALSLIGSQVSQPVPVVDGSPLLGFPSPPGDALVKPVPSQVTPSPAATPSPSGKTRSGRSYLASPTKLFCIFFIILQSSINLFLIMRGSSFISFLFG